MRLITTFELEKEAFQFTSFLKTREIDCSYALSHDQYEIWVVKEEDVETAFEYASQFRENPNDPLFVIQEPTFIPPKNKEGIKIKVELRPKMSPRLTLTNFLIALCVILFFWNAGEEAEILESQGMLALQIKLSELQQDLLFDYPKSYQVLSGLLGDTNLKDYTDVKDVPPNIQTLFAKADAIPYWRGIADVVLNWKETGWNYLQSVPMFEKIRQGEVWRFFTPCMLHRDFLHILFNMAWLFILGRQIEARLKKWRMALLIVVIGVISNTAQYLVGGPYFLGMSGVVVGMVGYIWMRQRSAPWEGYPLQRSVLMFVTVFVLAMFSLELIATLLRFFEFTKQSPSIANTAHIVGGLVGLALGRMRAFAKVHP